ncbi:hypothetical protein LPJ56_004492 [Coemansia sp. RSA 2599]|nr:hypothetical protein LPJ75_004336 [Coemansia sp. RSA 2598]KAJ1815691.1 hypothetical protein LPJ56_004492 [Coemansia sp. RSA 2599]
MPSIPLDKASAEALLGEEILCQKGDDHVGILRPYTWEEVKLVVAAERLDLLGRTIEKELAYREDMKKVREEYGSVLNYVRTVKLAAFIQQTDSQHLVIPNDYPYALPDNVLHYIVWSKEKLTEGNVPDPVIQCIFEERLDKDIGPGRYEWIWFVNPPHLQSIPEVNHGHLIVLKL